MNTMKRKILPLVALALILSAGSLHAGDPYVGEIKLFAGNFAPLGWAFADGSLLPISENEALFTLIGTAYGGDGQSTFALPDLRGRLPVHQGTLGSETIVTGTRLGASSVILTAANLPGGQNLGDQAAVNTQTVTNASIVAPDRSANTVNTQIRIGGSSAPIILSPPSLGLNYIISLYGVFPSQN